MEIRVAERLIVVRGRCWVSYPEAASIKKKKKLHCCVHNQRTVCTSVFSLGCLHFLPGLLDEVALLLVAGFSVGALAF